MGPREKWARMGESQVTTVRLTRLWQPLCGGKTSGHGVYVPGWEPCDPQARYFLPHAKPTKSRFAVRERMALRTIPGAQHSFERVM